MGKPAGRPGLRRLMVRRRLLVERLGERRVLAAISGAVFEDSNFSLHREVGEVNAPQRLVFIDANRNAQLDNGEFVSLAGPDGEFRFENLADGSYLLRLYNGSASQVQTSPVELSDNGLILPIEQARQVERIGSDLVAISDQSLVIADPVAGGLQTIPLGEQLSKFQKLPNGNLLVVGADSSAPNSWLVDPQTGSVTILDLDASEVAIAWSDLALDGSGRGLLLEDSDEPFALRAVDASIVGGNAQVSTTSVIVPSDTQVLASATGARSVLAWTAGDGLQTSLWSNLTSSLIWSSVTSIDGAAQLLAFDDDAGLLAVRTNAGGVRLHDVDADFAPLHTWEGMDGPIALDASRDLLVALSPQEAMLKLFSLRDGSLIADWAIDIAAVGPVTSLSFTDDRAIGLLGAAGLTEIALRKAAAHEVTIVDGQDADRILFGVGLRGENTPPVVGDTLNRVTDEDTTLIEPAPGVLDGSSDAEGDAYVLVQRSEASHGVALVQVDGSISYTPSPDYNGSDSVVFLLHDGRDASAEATLSLTVNPVPDAPLGISVFIPAIPEAIEPGTVVGTIEVIDADGMENLVIDLPDPRFGVNGNQIIFLGGPLEFKKEPKILVPVSVTDTEAGVSIETIVAFTVSDPDGPQPFIWPDVTSVPENLSDVMLSLVGVEDLGQNRSYSFTVDDERFEIVGNELRLVAGSSFDYETDPFVVIQVTATADDGIGRALTESIRIDVEDLVESPQSIQLSNDTVMEEIPGEVVGELKLDGVAPDSRFQFAVNDPRFEVVGATLKLLDDQFVEFANQAEIELEITAIDSQRTFSSISQTFLIEVIENLTPAHNHHNPFDVDHNGHVTALDALAIINYLNTYGPGHVNRTDNGYCYDVNADSMVTALDVLLVLNEMNRLQLRGGTVGSGEGDGEGEKVPAGGTAATNNTTVPDSIKDDSPLDPSETQDEVFGLLGSGEQETSIVSAPTGGESEDRPVEITEPTSQHEFAENVDQTLRLLSDESV